MRFRGQQSRMDSLLRPPQTLRGNAKYIDCLRPPHALRGHAKFESSFVTRHENTFQPPQTLRGHAESDSLLTASLSVGSYAKCILLHIFANRIVSPFHSVVVQRDSLCGAPATALLLQLSAYTASAVAPPVKRTVSLWACFSLAGCRNKRLVNPPAFHVTTLNLGPCRVGGGYRGLTRTGRSDTEG